jgi:hypothetical protein
MTIHESYFLHRGLVYCERSVPLCDCVCLSVIYMLQIIALSYQSANQSLIQSPYGDAPTTIA